MAKSFTLELNSVLCRINITRLISAEDGRDEHVLSPTHYSHVAMKKISALNEAVTDQRQLRRCGN